MFNSFFFCFTFVVVHLKSPRPVDFLTCSFIVSVFNTSFGSWIGFTNGMVLHGILRFCSVMSVSIFTGCAVFILYCFGRLITIFSFPSKLLLDSRETAGVCRLFPFGINISPKLIGIVLDKYQILHKGYFCLFSVKFFQVPVCFWFLPASSLWHYF